MTTQNQSVTFDQLIAIILSIYFVEILFHRKHQSTNSQLWKNGKISLAEFKVIFTTDCYFLGYQVPEADLETIFKKLDTDNDGYITFQQYIDFIRQYLGDNIDFWSKPKDSEKVPENVSEEEFGFVNAIWDELKAYFDKYD